MFQLESKWFLAEAEKAFKDEIDKIRLRGYADSEREIPIPSEFSNLTRFPSVDDIAFQSCPTRRDFYLKKFRRLQGKRTWGRIAGPLVEEYCKGLLDKFHKRTLNNFVQISLNIHEYDNEYNVNHSNILAI